MKKYYSMSLTFYWGHNCSKKIKTDKKIIQND